MRGIKKIYKYYIPVLLMSRTRGEMFFRSDRDNLFLSKKGLSDIVTTLIIVLLVLVALGVVWAVVSNILQTGSEQANIDRFTLNLEIKSVKVEQGNVTVVILKRNSGQGNFTALDFVFSDGKNSEIIRQNVSLKELDLKSFTFTLTQINASNLKTVLVAPVFALSSGKEQVGSVADEFNVPANASSGSTGTGAVVNENAGGKFEAMGFLGKGDYSGTVSSNPGIYPEFKSLDINPLDVRVGDNQTLTAVVYSPYGITNVTAVTQLDNETLTLNLTKVSDNNGTSTWTKTWTVYDTHIDTYRTNFTAVDNNGDNSTVGLTWTDACTDQFVQGSESLISIDCNVVDVRGADSGNIVVDSQVTLTISTGGTVAYTPGYSISKLSKGTIFMAGGQITKQYTYYYDRDNDGRADNTTSFLIAPTTTKSGEVRTTSNLGIDCNPTNANVYAGSTHWGTATTGWIAGYTGGDYNCDGSAIGGSSRFSTFAGDDGTLGTFYEFSGSCFAFAHGNCGDHWNSVIYGAPIYKDSGCSQEESDIYQNCQ